MAEMDFLFPHHTYDGVKIFFGRKNLTVKTATRLIEKEIGKIDGIFAEACDQELARWLDNPGRPASEYEDLCFELGMHHLKPHYKLQFFTRRLRRFLIVNRAHPNGEDVNGDHDEMKSQQMDKRWKGSGTVKRRKKHGKGRIIGKEKEPTQQREDIFIKTLQGKTIVLHPLGEYETILQLKYRLWIQTGDDVLKQRFLKNGRELPNHETLAEAGLETMKNSNDVKSTASGDNNESDTAAAAATVHYVYKLRGS
eukprot:CAMPEP_0185270146 /NCGR_PEP_ID=MMETSP1359-20130426/41581_1 /TAXON_ID=552665 /ORGANISM="Bigelowiella longifila, Strain CCMP242" /LENGTH=252 /DNA_ID=CAMNT_0027861597 /DNA_START=258 /DNA_END=1016 /DNA_ORIENTATION=+